MTESLSGAENFFESHDGWTERPKQRLKPIALVRLPDKHQDRRLGKNPWFIRVSGVFYTTKDWEQMNKLSAEGSLCAAK